MVGQTISHYKITEKLGEGGMGVVYKAEDTKLRRVVALKFLRAELIEDPEHRERFLREAQAAAALDHPNICTIHEIDEDAGRTFLAMAFIAGLTVKDKIAQRPLKLDQALDIAVQTVQGLQAAHEKGIVHRDIKGANLMVTPPGQVKIMDFGLAQLAERSKLTETTTILGTPSYMSPEQALGKKTDRRADLWSLGVVLYEMIAGRLPFVGERQEAILYGVTDGEPEPVTAQRAGLPLELEWIIGKALAKDRNERYQHAEDVLVDLRSLQKKLASGRSSILKARAGTQAAATQSAPAGQASPGPLARYRVIEDVEEQDDSVLYRAEDTQLNRLVDVRVVPQSSAQRIARVQRRKQTLVLGAGVLGVLLALVFAFLWVSSTDTAAEAPLRRSAFTPPVAVNTHPFFAGVAISPDGKHVAYTTTGAEGKLWVRDLDQEQPRAIERTEGAYLPFWSPDSNFIGFAAGREVQKAPVQGGPPMRLCELPGRRFYGGSWSPDGDSVVFSSQTANGAAAIIHEVPAQGGVPSPLIGREDSDGSSEGPTGPISRPHFLPSEEGSRVLVFTFGGAGNSKMMLQDLDTGRREFLGPGDRPFYSPSGHLVYQPERNVYDLWALPFSLETLQGTGEAFPIAQNSRQPTVAADNTLGWVFT